jgi:hypothetical protein
MHAATIVGTVRRFIDERARGPAGGRNAWKRGATHPGLPNVKRYTPRVSWDEFVPDIGDRNKKASHHAAHHYYGRRRSHG